MENKLLTVKEIARYLSVSTRQIYRLIDVGLPHRIVGKHYRFSFDDVLDWTKNAKIK